MARILIAFFSSLKNEKGQFVIPCFYDGLISNLAANGNKIFVIRHDKFNVDFGELHDELIENAIRTFNPDIAFIFNNSFFDIARQFSFPIVIYDVDSPKYFSNKDILRANPDRYKFITSQKSTVNTLSSLFNVDKNNILHIPFFTEIKNVKMPKIHNISFIGTYFPYQNNCGFSPWSMFLTTRPKAEAKESFKTMLAAIEKHPAQEQKIINKYKQCGLKIDFLDKECDLLSKLSGARRELALSQVSDLGLAVYGTFEWLLSPSADPDLVLAYNPRPVSTLQENQDVYNSSKIGININHVQADSGFSWRVLDIMASGACLVTEQNARLKQLFPHIDIPTFKDRFEAREVCKKILADEAMRLAIVEQCNEAIDKGYRFSHAIGEIENFLNMKFTDTPEAAKEGTYKPYVLHLG